MKNHVVNDLRNIVFLAVSLKCCIVGFKATSFHKRYNLKYTI